MPEVAPCPLPIPNGNYDRRLTLATLPNVSASVQCPRFARNKVTRGIVHIGPSNFFLAHFGPIIDDVLAGDPSWGIMAASIRSRDTVQALNAQDGLYTLVVSEADRHQTRVLAPIVEALYAPDRPGQLINAIADPRTKLVTMTVTPAGYHLSHGTLDLHHPDIQADLCGPDSPKTIYGYLCAGLRLRSSHGTPLTVMSLDNLGESGDRVRRALIRFAELHDPSLVPWVELQVDFPNTCVDRITPKPADSLKTSANAQCDIRSEVVIGTEAFWQLVVRQPRFCVPPWEAAGVLHVADCAAYTERKFALVNGGHLVVAVPALRLGIRHVHEALHNQAILSLLQLAHDEYVQFLKGDHTELKEYAARTRSRFCDPALNDRAKRVARDTTVKVSTRVLYLIEQSLQRLGSLPKAPVFVTAVWLLNLGRRSQSGAQISLDDHYADRLGTVHATVMDWLLSQTSDGSVSLEKLQDALGEVSDITKDPRFARMASHQPFLHELALCLTDLHQLGLEAAVANLLARSSL